MSAERFTHRRYDVEIGREVDRALLRWPEHGEAGGDEAGLGGNRQYTDLRWFSWREAKRWIALEAEYMERVESAEDVAEELHLLKEEVYFEPDDSLGGLDLGVAGVVAALSAARCIPYSSCNAGAYGDAHHEAFPLVAFHVRGQTLVHVDSAAEEAAVGLYNADDGGVVAYADGIPAMRRFAAALVKRSAAFNRVRYSVPRSPKLAVEEPAQARLFE